VTYQRIWTTFWTRINHLKDHNCNLELFYSMNLLRILIHHQILIILSKYQSKIKQHRTRMTLAFHHPLQGNYFQVNMLAWMTIKSLLAQHNLGSHLIWWSKGSHLLVKLRQLFHPLPNKARDLWEIMWLHLPLDNLK
jgi:hypothetical protein